MNAISFRTLRSHPSGQAPAPVPSAGAAGSESWGLFACLLLCILLLVGGVFWRTHVHEQYLEVTKRINECNSEIKLLTDRQRNANVFLSREQSSEALQFRLNRSPASADLKKREPSQVRIPASTVPSSRSLPINPLARPGPMLSRNS